MDSKYIDPFINSVSGVFASLGFGEISRRNIFKKETFTCRYNLTTIIGISGGIRGNIALSMPYDTAKKNASAMMMGMEIAEIDEISVSALGELTNMICGQAAIELSGHNLEACVTPPTIIHGDNMKIIISQVETMAVELDSPLGTVELNIGLEI